MKKVIAGLAILGVSGCSTMFNESEQNVRLNSYGNHNVPVSVLTPSGTYKDITPTIINIQPGAHSSDYIVQVDEPCYGVTKVVVKKELTASYWLNSLNLVGFFIDYATGAMWNYEEKVVVPIHRAMNCETASS
ncbi:MAG: hypothetical protein V7785_15840 [Bermanella sp.]